MNIKSKVLEKTTLIVERFIQILKILKNLGVDNSRLTCKDTIETLAQKSGISIDRIVEVGLDPKEKIGDYKKGAAQIYREHIEILPITEIQKLIPHAIKVLKKLDKMDVIVSIITSKDTIETLTKKSGVSIDRIRDAGLKPEEEIGNILNFISEAYRRDNKIITIDELNQFAILGIFLGKKELLLQEAVIILGHMQEMGADISKLELKDTIETLAQKSNIDIEMLIKNGLNPEGNIGFIKEYIKPENLEEEIRRKDKDKLITEEQLEELERLGIKFRRRYSTKNVFIKKLEMLQRIGVDVSKMTTLDTIETLAQKSGVSIEEIIELGLDPKEKIGASSARIVEEYTHTDRNQDNTSIEVEKLKSMGIKFKKIKYTIQDYIDLLERLHIIGINLSIMVELDTIETLAQKSGVSIEKIIELGLDPTEKVGARRNRITQILMGNVKGKLPTRDEIEKLKSLGINVEKRNMTTQDFIDLLEKIQEIGVDNSKLVYTDTIETLAKKSGVGIEKILEAGLDPKEKVGNKKRNVTQAYRGKGNCKPPTEEEVKQLARVGIFLDKESRTGKEIAKATISSLEEIEMIDREDKALRDLAEKTREGGKIENEQS